MIKLFEVTLKDKELLWNINQKYLYEMTMYYPDVMDEKGVLHYGYFEQYFIDSKRKAYFLFNDEIMVGFAMIHPYSTLEHKIDYSLAEFTIFPSYRGNHYAYESANLILEKFKGKWEIKYNNKNIKAMNLWTKVTEPYNPKMYRLNQEEIVLEFVNK